MNPIKSILPIIILLSTSSLKAQIHQVTPSAKSVSQYDKVEFNIRLTAEWNCPYTASDVSLDMHLTSPDGKRLIVPCFYCSGKSCDSSLWKVRLTPREAGCYFYEFVLMDNGKGIDKSESATLSVSASNKKGFLQPHNKWSFQFDNGDIFRGIGENIGWEARSYDDSKFYKTLHEDPRFNYEDMLTTLKSKGGNFFRTWMIYWNLPVDWKTVRNSNRYQNSTSRFNESGIKRMDELVELCDSLGVYMMLVLESHAGYLGEGWDLNNYNKENGGPVKTALDFFTDAAAKSTYKDKLRFIIARWGYSPSIAAWEFFNEVDNVMYNRPEADRIPDHVITHWHAEMSDYLKKNDPYNHIITTSVSHRDVEGLNDIPTLDVNQKHIYKHTKDIPSTLHNYSNKYKKPYIIGEFGYEWDWQKNFNDISEGMDSDFKRGLWYGLFSPTPVLPMTWWWEFFDERGMTAYFQNVLNIHTQMVNAGKGQYEQLKAMPSINKIETLAVRCGSAIFVYVRNPKKVTVETNIELEQMNPEPNISQYDCEAGLYHESRLTTENNILKGLRLSGFCDQIIVIQKKEKSTNND